MGGGDGGALAGNNPNVDERLGMISCRKVLAEGGRNGTKGPPYGTDRKEEDDCVTLEAKDVILDIEIESMLEHIDWKKEGSHLNCVP
jgi:hypothetical protein